MASNTRTGSQETAWIIGIALALIALIIVVGVMAPTKSKKTTREVALTCTTDMATRYHIHTYLEIMVQGVPQEIPANVGVRPTCMNALHTHGNDGKIHVESPEKRDFTLADFFAVWDKPFTKDQILDSTVDKDHVIRETVNGRDVQDYETTVLRDNDKIVISYEERK